MANESDTDSADVSSEKVVVLEIENDVIADFPAFVKFDDVSGDIVGGEEWYRKFLLLITGGDKKKLRDIIVRGGEYRDKVLSDVEGVLRIMMVARCWSEIMSRPSERDPIEWAKLLCKIIDDAGGTTKGGKHVHIHGENKRTESIVGEVLRVAESRKSTPKKKRKSGSD